LQRKTREGAIEGNQWRGSSRVKKRTGKFNGEKKKKQAMVDPSEGKAKIQLNERGTEE